MLAGKLQKQVLISKWQCYHTILVRMLQNTHAEQEPQHFLC